MTGIAERIARCVPGASFELEALVRLIGVEESDAVPTAAVSCRGRPRLLVNPCFVEEHCVRDEHLYLLVMHELWHVILGHTRLYERRTPAHNIAFDAVINAGLSRQHPDVAHRGFFEALNPPDRFPQLLLRPPIGWPDAPQYDVVGPAGTSTLMRRLYPAPGLAPLEPLYDELVELIESGRPDGEATDDGAGSRTPRLVGAHDDSMDPMTDPLVGDVMRRLVPSWRRLPVQVPGDSDGRPPWEWLVEARQASVAHRRQFADILRRALEPDPGGGRRVRATPMRIVVGPGPLPNPADRMLAARRALVGDNVLANQPLNVTVRGADRPRRALVYLDVSGSMDDVIGDVLPLLIPAARAGLVNVRQFSTEVVPLSVSDLSSGRLSTTGGTHIDCVLADAAERTERRMIILTDGEVGSPDAGLLARLHERGVQIHTVLPPRCTSPRLAPHSTIHHLGRQEAR